MRPLALARSLSVVTACLLAAAPVLAAEPAPAAPMDHTIKAPHYGDVLFQFYQDRYFTAITTLMTSQHFQRLTLHEDEAEVLRGGMLLSYGMHREAGEIFSRLAERGTEPAVRDRALFYLAKVRYIRGLYGEADQALSQVSSSLSPELEDERRLLQAQIQLALGRPAKAATALNSLATQAAAARKPAAPAAKTSILAKLTALVASPFTADPLARPDGDATLYARYNLGVALIRSGDAEQGAKWLDDLGQMPAANEEQRRLRDQANLALGYSALQREEPEKARAWLERVRLNGPSSNKALLGFGWAAMALKKPELALVPWNELAGRDPGDPAVLEARIAVPYALAELGADADAMNGYEQALTAFQEEAQHIDTSVAALRQGDWLDQLVKLNPDPDMGWFHQAEALPELPHSQQLAPILAGHAFQEGFKTLRDLRFLQDNLREWQDKLGSYSDMLNTRRDAFNRRLPQVLGQSGQVDLGPLIRRQQALTDALAQAQADGDGQAFADERQRGLKQRLERVQATLAQAAASERTTTDTTEQAATAERLRLLNGALTWELSQAYPDRAWQASKSLKVSEAALARSRQGLADLQQAQRDEAERLVQFEARIGELNQRIQRLMAPLATLGSEQTAALRDVVIDSLGDQKERLAGYSTQARYGVAQLHDQSRQLQEREHDAPR